MDKQPSTFSISDLAREFGITPRPIRCYEDQGLISPRREGRTRIFSHRDRTRLKLALRGKRLGFSLAEIGYLIGMYATERDKNAQLSELLNGLGQRKAALVQQREDIEAVLHEVSAYELQCQELFSAREAREASNAVVSHAANDAV